jgi:hypothetical protein
MAVVTVDYVPPKYRWGWIALLLLTYLGFVSWAAVVAGRADPPVSCRQHAGDFDNNASTDFDVNRVDCRVAGSSSTAHLWNVPPYIGFE